MSFDACNGVLGGIEGRRPAEDLGGDIKFPNLIGLALQVLLAYIPQEVAQPRRLGQPLNRRFKFRSLPLHYQTLTVTSHGSYQNYNSLQVSWQKQAGWATFIANYSFSKVMGIRDGETDNGGRNGSLVDPFNIKNNYGVLAYDHTHIANFAYIFNLPSPIHGNKFLGGAVNGWQLSGVTQMQSGAPIQPNTGGNLSVNYPSTVSNSSFLGTNAVVLTPALTCDPRSNFHSGQYFNPGCFAPPTPGANGSIVWPYIKGPAYFNSDLSVSKTSSWLRLA